MYVSCLAIRTFPKQTLHRNYEQLGLKFKLFSAEVLFNKGLSQIYMGNVNEGLADMEDARREKATDEHGVIDDAIADRGEGYTVFSIPVGVLYRPSENKLKNSRAKDYMGKAKLVAAADATDAFTEFTGVNRLRNGITPSGTIIRKPGDDDPSLARSVTVPAPRNNDLDPIAGVGAGLGRSKTTLNVPSDARERIAGLSAGGPPVEGSAGEGSLRAPPSMARANSVRERGETVGSPVRGLSVRKNSTARPPTLPEKEQGQAGTRLTEFYDDYFDSREEEIPPPLPTQSLSNKQDKISAWARANANPAALPPSAMLRSQSRSAPPSTYAPSSYGGGSMRRRVTRRTTRRITAAPSMYDEEEEGYGSGEYDDGPFELIKIRVKVCFQSN